MGDHVPSSRANLSRANTATPPPCLPSGRSYRDTREKLSVRIDGRSLSAHVSVKHRTEGLLFMSRSLALSSATLEMTPRTFECR